MKLIALSTISLAYARISEECFEAALKVSNGSLDHHALVCNDEELRSKIVECFGEGETFTFTETDIINMCRKDDEELPPPPDEDMRSFGAQGSVVMQQQVSTENLQSYGCWCNIASDWQIGRGEPVDGMDQACRNVHHSYTCLAKEGCDKDMVWITAPIFNFATARIEWDCAVNSRLYPDEPEKADCALKTCTIGLHLVSASKNLFFSGQGLQPGYVHSGSEFQITDYLGNVLDRVQGQFDFDSECTAIPGIRDVKCCGNYPFRREYDTNRAECCLEGSFEKIRGCGQCYENDLVYSSEC